MASNPVNVSDDNPAILRLRFPLTTNNNGYLVTKPMSSWKVEEEVAYPRTGTPLSQVNEAL